MCVNGSRLLTLFPHTHSAPGCRKVLAALGLETSSNSPLIPPALNPLLPPSPGIPALANGTPAQLLPSNNHHSDAVSAPSAPAGVNAGPVTTDTSGHPQPWPANAPLSNSDSDTATQPAGDVRTSSQMTSPCSSENVGNEPNSVHAQQQVSENSTQSPRLAGNTSVDSRTITTTAQLCKQAVDDKSTSDSAQANRPTNSSCLQARLPTSTTGECAVDTPTQSHRPATCVERCTPQSLFAGPGDAASSTFTRSPS